MLAVQDVVVSCSDSCLYCSDEDTSRSSRLEMEVVGWVAERAPGAGYTGTNTANT